MADDIEVVRANLTPAEVRTKKIASCAISLGSAILKEMVGTTIADPAADQDINELMATAVLGELKL